MASFRMDNWIDNWTDNAKWFVVAGCIVINIVLGKLDSALGLPIFLDTIGTILAALLLGPWMGMLTGLCSNLIWGLISGLPAEAFAPVSMAIGLSSGYLGRHGMFRSLPRVFVAGILVSIVATLVATPIRTYLFSDGQTGVGADFLILYLSAVGQNLIQSVAWAIAGVNLIDKVLSCVIAWGIVKAMPKRLRAYFPEICPSE